MDEQMKWLKELADQLFKDGKQLVEEDKQMQAHIALVVARSVQNLYIKKLNEANAVQRIEIQALEGLKEMLDRGEHP